MFTNTLPSPPPPLFFHLSPSLHLSPTHTHLPPSLFPHTHPHHSRYDGLKANNLNTIWYYIPRAIKKFPDISSPDLSLFETSSRVGDYKIGDTIGEGQFADVKVAVRLRAGAGNCESWTANGNGVDGKN